MSRSRRSSPSRLRTLRPTAACGFEALEQKLTLNAVPTGGLIEPATTDLLKDQKDPVVAKATSTNAAINGDFVVVWEHEFDSPNSFTDTDIFGRVYDANGVPKTSTDFAIADSIREEQDPRVSMAADGSFVVVWEEENVNGDFDVMYRRFNADGVAIDPEGVRVHGEDELEQADPDVAMFSNGAFVVVWSTDTGESTDVQFRRFSANATPLDTNPIDLADTTDDEYAPRVAATKSTTVANYRFTATWTRNDAGIQRDIYRDLRRFSDGTSITGHGGIIVTDDQDIRDLNQDRSSVAMDATGRAVITWSQITTAGNNDIFYKRFDQDGDPLDPNLRRVVDDSTSRNTDEHEVSMANQGQFIVVIEISSGANGTVDTRYRLFDFDLPDQPGRTTALLDPTFLPSLTLPPGSQREPANQDNPAVAMNGTGEFTIVWDDTFVTAQRQDIIARNYRNNVETVGMYEPSTALFFLRNSNTTGVADISFRFGPGFADQSPDKWIPIEGDFDGDGISTVGLYDPARALFYLRNSNTGPTAVADKVVNFGLPGWFPIVGDWDGDGVQTIGAFAPALGRFFLRNTNTSGVADVTFLLGALRLEDNQAVVGDWDGDGIETVGVFDPRIGTGTTSRFELTNDANPQSGTATTFRRVSMAPVNGRGLSGDFDRDGKDSIGIYDPATSLFYLVDDLPTSDVQPPVVTATFLYGIVASPAWLPIMGDWDGPGADPLLAAETPLASMPGTPTLSTAQAQALIGSAVGTWLAAGLDPTAAARLSAVAVSVRNLGGGQLGLVEDGAIVLDDDGAGHGWFLDSTPGEDEEFSWLDGARAALSDAAAADRYDLLTVLNHELGHILGLDDEPAQGPTSDLMAELLGLGVRRTPGSAEVDRLFGAG
ncbi:MAG: hypothetical protein K1X74_19625 [Pirellulales bacterium]|nr:hypothetical protein [Pirellulales bacterium]